MDYIETSAERKAVVIDLPFPPSVNRIWRHGKRVHLADEYQAWKTTADKFVMYSRQLRGAVGLTGPFHCEIILDRNERRRAGDLDNRIKPLLDWAQRAELIRNDRDLERLTAFWGEAPHGCRLTLEAAP
jgi:Holliday junction resolvase RusA-like endonuclease